MTEEQKKLKAERDRRYREKKKAEKAAEKDLQAPIDPALESVTDDALEREWNALPSGKIVPYRPESAMQAPDSGLKERYRKELQQDPVLEEPLTYFDVYKRRHEEMFK